MRDIAVLGCGSWGTALAIVLAGKELPVTMWCRRAEQAREMRETRENRHYLPGVALPGSVRVTTSLEDAIRTAEHIVLAVPSQALRALLEALRPYLPEGALLINTAKGLEVGTNLRMSQVAEEVLPGIGRRFAVLYGPSHAEEVGRGLPAAVVACSANTATAEAVQDLFMCASFRVYTNRDLVGVEIGGAVKNIIAIATGISSGLGLGDNAQAALITRGMAEITRLGVRMGADPQTFSGLTGIGDLVVTCTSLHSRNHRCGLALGQGKKLDEILRDMGMVVEGVETTRATVELARQLGVYMPISEMMYRVLFENFSVERAVTELMCRDKKREGELA